MLKQIPPTPQRGRGTLIHVGNQLHVISPLQPLSCCFLAGNQGKNVPRQKKIDLFYFKHANLPRDAHY